MVLLIDANDAAGDFLGRCVSRHRTWKVAQESANKLRRRARDRDQPVALMLKTEYIKCRVGALVPAWKVIL